MLGTIPSYCPFVHGQACHRLICGSRQQTTRFGSRHGWHACQACIGNLCAPLGYASCHLCTLKVSQSVHTIQCIWLQLVAAVSPLQSLCAQIEAFNDMLGWLTTNVAGPLNPQVHSFDNLSLQLISSVTPRLV
jgi:hypothetical protein